MRLKKYEINRKIELLAFLIFLKENKDIYVKQYSFDLREIEKFYNSLPAFNIKNIKNRRTIEDISDELINQLQKCQNNRSKSISHLDRFDDMLIGKMLAQVFQNNIYAKIEIGDTLDKFKKIFHHNNNQ